MPAKKDKATQPDEYVERGTAFSMLTESIQDVADAAALCRVHEGFSPAQRRVFAAIEADAMRVGMSLSQMQMRAEVADRDV